MKTVFVLAAAAIVATPTLGKTQSCSFSPAFQRADHTQSIQVFESAADPKANGQKPLLFVVPRMNVNTDGTRISYKMDDPRAQHGAINDMRNAMRAGHSISEFQAIAAANWQPLSKTWTILSPSVIEKSSAPATRGQPCVANDRYLVSMTSVGSEQSAFAHMGDCRQSKWLDALSVPAFVLPKMASLGRRHVPTKFDYAMRRSGASLS